MSKPLVSIGLVTWNSAARLLPTLNAMADAEYPNWELIVVDNASKDNSVALVRERFPDIQIIQNQENCGFCGGHNQAISASSGKYYLPLNPDVVMWPNYISSLVDVLEQYPTCGSAAGKLLQRPGVIDTTGLFMNRQRQQYLRGHGEADHGQFETPGEVFGVDGAAPLYRCEMLEDIKVDGQYFDESFFSHKEDVDVAWRARLLGWRCWYTPDAVAFHERSFRPGQRALIAPATRVHAVKNRYLLLVKNELLSGLLRDCLQILWYDLKIFAYVSLFERTSFAAMGLLRQNWSRARMWRKETMARKRVKQAELLSWFK